MNNNLYFEKENVEIKHRISTWKTQRDIPNWKGLFAKKLSKLNYLTKPDYVISNDSLYPLYQNQNLFWMYGNVMLGSLVQANTLLFRSDNNSNCPAVFLYTNDDYYYENPEELSELSKKLFSLKGLKNLSPEVQYFADLLFDEYSRKFAIPLPKELTNGHNVFLTTVVVHRNHIPYNRIVSRLYPLLVLENKTPDAIILPKWYWTEYFNSINTL